MNREKDDDVELFRAETRDVRPLRARGHHPPHRRSPPAHPRQREADEREVLNEMMHGPPVETGEELGYRSAGVQESVFRKLKRGTYRISDELDLHGMTSDGARLALAGFLARCRERDLRCVRIIHGKGLRSKGQGPVLKQRVDHWLRRRADVLAYCSARPEHGGTGAVYVLLRRA